MILLRCRTVRELNKVLSEPVDPEFAPEQEEQAKERYEMETAGIRDPEDHYWMEQEDNLEQEDPEIICEGIRNLRKELVDPQLHPHIRGFRRTELEIYERVFFKRDLRKELQRALTPVQYVIVVESIRQLRQDLIQPYYHVMKEALQAELEVYEQEMARRRLMGRSNTINSEAIPQDGSLPIEFLIDRKELAKALKFLRPAKARGKGAQSEFVDINARESEVELVTTGASLTFPAKITTRGYGRAPFLVFERLIRAVATLKRDNIPITILQGRVRAERLTFSHPDISVRLIGARIADLPIDASLADVLELLVKYRPEELEDSGLGARVLSAREQVTKIIDRAMEILGSTGIQREALSEFIWEQIKKRSIAPR